MLLPVILLSAIAAPLRVVSGGKSFHTASSDAELVAGTLAGDRKAATELVERHLPKVLSRVRQFGSVQSDAEDIAQDAFVEALRDLSTLRDPTRFGPWVRGIAVHQAHRRLRRRKWLSPWVETNGSTPPLHDSEFPLEDRATDPSTRVHLAELDVVLSHQRPLERLAWMLRHVEGQALHEVAEETGVSLATVKRSIAKVQAQVRAHFGQEIFEGEEAP